MRQLAKRGMAVCLLLLMLLPLVTGCHGAPVTQSFTVPETFDTSKPYEITFWAKNDTNKNQVLIYERAVSDFEALYPHIKVNLRLYTDYNKMYQDVITNIATQTTPNVCITYPDHIATYLEGEDVVVPLDALMTHPVYGLGSEELPFDAPAQDEIVPQFLEECYLNGVCYALPFMRSTEACYINKTYVERLGYTVPDVLTWDFIWEVADKAAAKNADGTYVLNGQKVLIPFIYKSTDNMMIQMLAQRQAGYSDARGEIAVFNDDTRDILYTVAEHTKTGAFSTFKISSYPANFLNAGQCLFAIDSTAGATWMGTDAPLCDISQDKIVSFELAVRPIPQEDPDRIRMISQGPSVCLFNKEDPQEVLAAWLFTAFLLTDSVQFSYAQTEGYVPVTTRVQESDVYQDYLAQVGADNDLHYRAKIEAVQMLRDYTANTFTTEVFNGSTSLREAAGEMIERVTKSVRRKETVDDAYLDALFDDITIRYHLNECGPAGAGRQLLGPLPATAVVLLVSLGVTWCILGAAALISRRRKRKKSV